MIEYSQYYTQQIFSRLLINSIDFDTPISILDMGVGDGALTKAALERWHNAQYFAVDIDKKNCELIRNISDSIFIANEDGLDPDISKKLQVKVGSIDVAICNPPYGMISNSSIYKKLFYQTKLKSCLTLKKIPVDIVFLANNLSLLKKGGQLGIILPDGILTRKDLKNVRQDILLNNNIKCIIQLPDKIFKGTEARTHILILEKGHSRNNVVSLLLADKHGNYINSLLHVSKWDLIERMDYSYHAWKKNRLNRRGITLKDIGAEINRGSLSHKQTKSMYSNYIHTTNMNNINYEFDKSYVFPNNYITCKKGDILLARVGKRCIGKLAVVKKGEYIITDCVYRIRVPNEYSQRVFAYLSSDLGKEWLNVMAHGVCAKVVSKEDLLNLSIPIENGEPSIKIPVLA